jgi:tetratricopeptide (TPR) repeat protein
MTAKISRSNPYIAGRALNQKHGFFGRENTFRLVETELASPDQNAVVLFGQRRIGKTSILLQLGQHLSSPPFLPIYFDLMDRARRSLGQVLFELASTIATEAGMDPARLDLFDDEGLYFRREFLPSLYERLGVQYRPVLLFDEFDVLDVAAEEQLPSTAAARAFFPYLRQLMQGEPRLGFIFVVGRRAEDLFIEFKATFKAARYKRISVLDEKSARELIFTAQRQGTLLFTEDAVKRILVLTAGHPYFTQLLCQIVWDGAYAGGPQGLPTIDLPAVEVAIPKALEAGENIFEWIWDGLPPAERVIFAAIAEATNERSVVTEEQLLELLQSQGVRILTRELELAPNILVEWEMLRQTDGGYGFFIELMRRWVALRKPLPKVKDELDRIQPLADMLYRSGDGFYRHGELENTQNQLRQALRVNPNHLKARLLLGQVLVEQGKMDEAIRELEEAYRYDEQATRYPLIRALLIRGEELERLGSDDEALTVYTRVLEASPRERVAQEHRTAIWIERGDAAFKADDLMTARAAYLEAGAQEKVVEVESLRRKREIERTLSEALNYEKREEWDKTIEVYQRLAKQYPDEQQWAKSLNRIKIEQQKHELEQASQEAQRYERQESWDRAIGIYQRMVDLYPEEQRWHEALEHVKVEQKLSQKYAEGLGASEQGNWSQAMKSLSEVVHTRPEYKNAAEVLARAVRKQQGKNSAAPIYRFRGWSLIGLILVGLLATSGAGYQIYQQAQAQSNATIASGPTNSAVSQPTSVATLEPPTPITPTVTSTPFTPTPSPTLTPSPSSTVLPTLSPGALVSAPQLNLRGGPSVAYPLLGVFTQGASLKVIGRDATGEWVQVETSDGLRGWMFTANLQVNTSLTSIPAITPPPSPTPRPTARPRPTSTPRPPATPQPTPPPQPTFTPQIDTPIPSPLPTDTPTQNQPRPTKQPTTIPPTRKPPTWTPVP